jgi:hypothetical protein
MIDMLKISISWQKKLCILIFFCIFSIIFLHTSLSKAEEITLTEEQKKQLQEGVKEQIKKMKESMEKMKQLSDQQQKSENQEQTHSQQSIQQASKEPEWDGIYVVDNSGNYNELISLSGAKAQSQRGSLTGRQYVTITILPKEVNNVPWNDFKGFFFKGQQLLQLVKVHKLTTSPLGLGRVFSFLSGVPGGDQYNIEDLQNNLYASQMRCKTKSDSAYCEFKDREYIKNYLGNGKSPFCLFMLTGESPEKGGKAYAICFAE